MTMYIKRSGLKFLRKQEPQFRDLLYIYKFKKKVDRNDIFIDLDKQYLIKKGNGYKINKMQKSVGLYFASAFLCCSCS